MTKIVDPDQLNQGTEVSFLPATLQVQCFVAGNLDNAAPGATSGVAKQALYSFGKEEWHVDATLNKLFFFLKAFTKNEFQYQNGWSPADSLTRLLMRDAGWVETVGAENGDQWACFSSLGNHDENTDQSYFSQIAGFDQVTTDFDKPGNINEPQLIYDASGPTDLTGYFKAFLRIQGKTYADYDLLDEQDIPTLEPTLYRFPLENGNDLNITETDNDIDTIAPFTGMAVDFLTGNHDAVTTWAATTAYAAGDVVLVGAGAYAGRYLRATVGGTSGASDPTGAGVDGSVTWEVDPGERQIGSTYYHFSKVIAANVGTDEQVYNWERRQLRKTTDINANTNGDAFGTVNGNLADIMLNYRGPSLILEPGVWIDNFDPNSQNDIIPQPHPVDGAAVAEVTFPRVSAGKFIFSQNIIDAADADTRLVLYFANDDAGDNTGRDFGTINALKVNNNSGTPIDFQVTAAEVLFDFDYTNNNQRGAGSEGVDAPVFAQLTGLADYENRSFPFTITDGTGLEFRIDASDERNYSNPA